MVPYSAQKDRTLLDTTQPEDCRLTTNNVMIEVDTRSGRGLAKT